MEANFFMAVTLGFITAVAVSIGKWWFKRWFNPLSIYSALWGFCLVNYELRLIQYYPISTIAWVYIAIAWVSLYLGAGTVLLLAKPRESSTARSFGVDVNCLKKVILTLSAIGSLGLISQLLAISHEFGNPVIALITNAGEIYGARISNELYGLNYAGAFSFAACTLAGIYTAKLARLTLVAAIPLVLVTLQLVAVMGRTGLGVAAVLFSVSFLYTPRPVRFSIPGWQRMIGAMLAAALAGGFILVSSIRRLDVNFVGITPGIEKVSEYLPFFPSLYSNFSATPVAFSLYLASPEQGKTGFWGMYTFAPAFRLISRLGFLCSVPAHEENYYTPVPMNTGTYLKNVHSDFGAAGILVFPYLLGASVTLLLIRVSSVPRLLGLTLLANLFVLVVFTFAFNFMLLGDWYIGLVVSALGAIVVDKRMSRADPTGLRKGLRYRSLLLSQ
jgi:oligosaccharide repeat unit polymerase